jgi:hypothetical protein
VGSTRCKLDSGGLGQALVGAMGDVIGGIAIGASMDLLVWARLSPMAVARISKLITICSPTGRGEVRGSWKSLLSRRKLRLPIEGEWRSVPEAASMAKCRSGCPPIPALELRPKCSIRIAAIALEGGGKVVGGGKRRPCPANELADK